MIVYLETEHSHQSCANSMDSSFPTPATSHSPFFHLEGSCVWKPSPCRGKSAGLGVRQTWALTWAPTHIWDLQQLMILSVSWVHSLSNRAIVSAFATACRACKGVSGLQIGSVRLQILKGTGSVPQHRQNILFSLTDAIWLLL